MIEGKSSSALVHQYLTLWARRHPDKDVLICGDERWTYGSIEGGSERLSRALTSAGLKQRDRAVVLLDNCCEAVLAIYAILKAGCTFVVLNHTVKARKLAYVMKDSGATVLITHVGRARIVNEALGCGRSDCQTLVWVGAVNETPKIGSVRSLSWDDLLDGSGPERTPAQGFSHLAEPCRGDGCCTDKDLAALIYTSGSTGEPKGVMTSHFNMISAATSIIQYLENTPDDIILNILPLSFDYGLYQIIMAFMFGGTVVLEKSFLFPIRVLELIPKERVTGFPIVPTMAALILSMDGPLRLDFSSLRYITNTAAALPVEHIRKLGAVFPHVKIYSMYGLTECKRVCYLDPHELDRRPASVGKPMPGCEVFLVDEHGKEVTQGGIGELVVRGPNVMGGYWNDPDLTEQTFRKGVIKGETVLFSGDLFRKDEEGFLYFVARKDELIKTKGERVSPREIEDVICILDGVAEAAAIGIPDEISGQAISCFVVCKPGFNLSKKDILKYCTENMETFMVPRSIDFLSEMPRTGNGKIDKDFLRRRLCCRDCAGTNG
jgi:amino acid adenylation domain-containing protein